MGVRWGGVKKSTDLTSPCLGFLIWLIIVAIILGNNAFKALLLLNKNN